MSLTRALTVLAALFLTTFVCPARAVPGEPPAVPAAKPSTPADHADPALFSYSPFPSIPSATIPENKLMAVLPAACKKLVDHEQIATTANCESAQGELTNDALKALAQGLKQACDHLRNPEQLQDGDLQCFRLLRDDPVRRDAIDKWQDENFAPEKLTEVRQLAGHAASNALLPGGSAASLADSAIRGLAEFLAQRAKQEALAYLRRQLTTKLCTHPGRQFFPRVCRAVEELDDGQSLESISALMRAAARADLKELPDVALDYVGTTQPTSANLTFAGRVGYRVYREAASGRAPTEVIANLGGIDLKRCKAEKCEPAARLVQSTSAIAFALLQAGPNNQWHANLNDLDQGDYPAAMVAVVLLAEARMKHTSALIEGEWVSVKVINIIARQPARLVEALRAAQASFHQLEESLTNENPPEGDEKRARTAQVLRGALVALAQQLNFAAELHGDSTGQAQQWAESLQAAGAVTAELLDEKYAEAVVQLGVFFKRQLAGTTADSKLEQLRRYLPLIVEIASAQDSQGVAAAFDSYAAPLGTYETKYHRSVIAINGMVGLLAGWETIDTQNVSGGSAFLAGFAPVGIHGTFVGNPNGEAKAFHFGVMVSLLDLGALTTHRFESELEREPTEDDPEDPEDVPDEAEVEQQPNISFAQVFSPGAYLTLGLGGSPFLFGAGVSYAPELRTVTDGAHEFEASALRYGAFLAVDIPILPLN